VRPGDELIIGESGGVLEKPAAMRLEPVYRPLLDARHKAGGGTNWDCAG
jgi:hypothetical protein